MPRAFPLAVLALLLPLLATCRDAPRPTAPEMPPAAQLSARPDSPYGCFTSAAMPEEAPFRYRYHKARLHFPSQALSPEGETTTYRYRAYAGDPAEPVYLANCVIPATRQAVEILNRRLGVREKEDLADGYRLMGPCPPTGCLIEGLDVKACQYGGEYPACNEKPQPQPEKAELSPCNPYLGDCGGGGGGGAPCSACTLASATLSCSASVPRGSPVTCAIDVGGTLSVGQWTWGAAPETGIADTVRGPSGGLRWEGTAVAGGKVSVPIREGETTRTLEGVFLVTPRGWRWATHAVSEYRDGTGEPCLNHTPSVETGTPGDLSGTNGFNLETGFGCAVARRMIQPDSWETGDGFTVATVPGGPNQGLHYVASAELRLRRESTYNRGMYPGARREVLKNDPGYDPSDYVHSQRALCGTAENGYAANWYEFSQCMYTRHGTGTNPDAFISAVRAHEGYGSTGHNGHFSAAYDAVADPENDPMIFLDQQVESRTIPVAVFAGDLRNQFRQHADRADREAKHIPEGGKVGNNWTGPVWIWFPWEGRFHLNTHSN